MGCHEFLEKVGLLLKCCMEPSEDFSGRCFRILLMVFMFFSGLLSYRGTMAAPDVVPGTTMKQMPAAGGEGHGPAAEAMKQMPAAAPAEAMQQMPAAAPAEAKMQMPDAAPAVAMKQMPAAAPAEAMKQMPAAAPAEAMKQMPAAAPAEAMKQMPAAGAPAVAMKQMPAAGPPAQGMKQMPAAGVGSGGQACPAVQPRAGSVARKAPKLRAALCPGHIGLRLLVGKALLSCLGLLFWEVEVFLQHKVYL